jgi:predicted enzyme related to lactoylglutathione lyase
MTQTAPTYALGTPLWIDHASPDVQAAARFYGQLFGWQAEDLGEQAGHYHMFRQDGKAVAATSPLMNDSQPTVWTTYVSTDNAAETLKKAAAAGGTVLLEPMVVMDQGTMAVFADPTGAAISLWQPAVMTGADLVNTPVSLTWNELQTRDMNKAKDFYPKVFPWGVKANAMPQGGEYVEWQVNGRSIAGGMQMSNEMPAAVPAHWLVYFSVADTDATAKRAQELGGKVMAPPMDIPQGRMAVLTDPWGASFGVIKNAAM